MPTRSAPALRAIPLTGSASARQAFAVLAIVGLAFLQLLPGILRGPYDDAAIFSVIGEELVRGDLPYRDAWDHKPPGIYLVTAAAALLPGATWPWVWLASVAAIIATALVLLRMTSPVTTALAVVSMAMWPVALGGGQTESFAVLPALLGFLAATRGRMTAAGALAAVAMLFSFQAAAVVPALLVLAGRGPRRLGALATGGAAVAIPSLVILGALGILPAAVDALVVYSRAYLTSDRTGDLGSWWQVVIAILPLAIVLPLRRGWKPVDRAALAWLLAVAVLVLLQGRLFAHYAIIAIPPLALLADPAIRTPPGRRIGVIAAACCLALALAAAWRDGGDASRQSATVRVGTAVAAATSPDDTILVWGHEANTYLSAGREPAGPYPYLMPLVTPGYSTPDQVAAWVTALQANPPAVIVDAEAANDHWPEADDFLKPPPPGATGGRDLDVVQPFRDWARRAYTYAGEVDGRKLYARNQP